MHVQSIDTPQYLIPTRDDEDRLISQALAILEKRTHNGPLLESPQDVKDYLRLRLAQEEREVFAVLFLDAQHRVITSEVMFTGTLTQTSVYPREVVRAALKHNCAAVILCHNHPSGDTTPSRADESLTDSLKTALKLVDIRVLDHIIVGTRSATSLAERGLL